MLGQSWPNSAPASRPTRIQDVRERRRNATAAIRAMPSQRRTSPTTDMVAINSIFKNDPAMARVVTAIAAPRSLLLIRAERYAGWERVSMLRVEGGSEVFLDGQDSRKASALKAAASPPHSKLRLL